MWLFGFNPEQVSAVLKRRNAVKDAAILAGTMPELEQVRRQALGPQQLAVAVDDDIRV